MGKYKIEGSVLVYDEINRIPIQNVDRREDGLAVVKTWDGEIIVTDIVLGPDDLRG